MTEGDRSKPVRSARLPQPTQASHAAILDALERANVGVVVLELRGASLEKRYANDAVVRKLGYTIEEWFALAAYEVIVPEQRQHVAQLYERLFASDFLPAAIEMKLLHHDGSVMHGEFAVGRADVPEGRVLALVARDLGPRPKAELTLLEADRLALVGALAAGFAHETNNPLTSVLLNIRSLRKHLLAAMPPSAQPAAVRCLDDITTGAERIASNVRALQTLATRGAVQAIDLAALVSAALRLAAPTLEPRARVIRQIFPVPPVAGEEARIGQAVLAMMLFSSSGFDGEHAQASNRIVIAVEERDGSVVVEVSDNGHELSADAASHAFDPFFRSPARGAGVGVGLGVARSVATALGGEVTLAPRAGGGAVITMWLPRAETPA